MQVFAEPECASSYAGHALSGTNYTAAGHCTYKDGTRSASSLTCLDINCCKYFLEGTHTKGDIQYESWRYINQLNCIDSSGKSKTYINGKDADMPTNISIESVDELNYAESHGNYSPAVAGDDNLVVAGDNNQVNSQNSITKNIIELTTALILLVVAVLGIKKWRKKKNKKISK